MPKVPPTTLPILEAPGMRTLCVADLNADGGSERTDGAIEPLTSYIAASTVNVITLQEMCANQYTSVQNALGSRWTGTFKRFGQMDGCHGRKHGQEDRLHLGELAAVSDLRRSDRITIQSRTGLGAH
jgi:hypothetical protein